MDRETSEARYREARTKILLARGDLIRAEAVAVVVGALSRFVVALATFLVAAHFLPLR
jgi:hypothetical protein